MIELTKRQEQVLTWIKLFIAEHSYSPTLRDIGEGLGISSTNGVTDHLNALIRKGKITRDHHKARSILIVGDDTVKVERDLLELVLTHIEDTEYEKAHGVILELLR